MAEYESQTQGSARRKRNNASFFFSFFLFFPLFFLRRTNVRRNTTSMRKEAQRDSNCFKKREKKCVEKLITESGLSNTERPCLHRLDLPFLSSLSTINSNVIHTTQHDFQPYLLQVSTSTSPFRWRLAPLPQHLNLMADCRLLLLLLILCDHQQLRPALVSQTRP